METPLTWSFVRDLHPLPPSDRRMLLKELGVGDVDHRSDDSFYGWLAERYRIGEAALVDRALRRCCAKAQARTSTQRLVTWLTQISGRPADPAMGGDDNLSELIASARASSAENSALIDALAASFPFLAADGQAQPSGQESTVADIIPRLTAALEALASCPEPTLLTRAIALAEAVEQHVATAGEKARRAPLLARLAAACAQAAGEEPTVPETANEQSLAQLEALAEAAEQLVAARSAERTKRAAWRDAADLPRLERRVAEEVLMEAEDRADAASARWRSLASPVVEPAAAEDDDAEDVDADGYRDDVEVGEQDDVVPLFEADAAANAQMVEPSPGDAEPDSSGPPTVALDHDVAAHDDAAAEDEAADAELREEAMPADEPVPAPAEPVQPAEPPSPATPWNAWINTALAAERVALAFHLATARDLTGGVGSMPVAVLAGALHGRTTRGAYDGAWHRYEALRNELVGVADASGVGADDQAAILLLVAGALRPALAQSQAALDVLQSLQGDIAAPFNSLVRLLGDMRGSGIAGASDLAAPAGADERGRRAVTARQALEEWRRVAPTRKTNYSPANWLWQMLVASDGEIGRVVADAIERGAAARDAVASLMQTLTDRAAAEAMILAADDRRGGRSRHNQIEGAALKQLLNLCGNTADLLDQWARAQGEANDGEDRHRSRRTALVRELRAARDVAIAAAPAGTAVAVAGGLLAGTIEALIAELEGREVGRVMLSSDEELALLPRFPLNARHDIVLEPDDAPPLAEAAADALAGGAVPSLAQAFAGALDGRNASAARLLLPRLAPPDQRGAEARLEAMIVAERARIAERARGLRQRLDDLQIALGADDRPPDAIEREMNVFEQGAVQQLPLDSAERGDLADFPAAHHRLDAIEARLDAARAPIMARLRQAIAEQEAQHGQQLEECRLLLEQGDLGTLAELIAQSRKHGLSAMQTPSSVELLRRFAATVGALGEAPSLDLVKLQRLARDGGAAAPFSFAALEQSDRARSERLIASWIALRRAASGAAKGDVNANVRDAVIQLMTELGFTGVRVEQLQRERTLFRLTVATVPLRARDRCLVPAFGSDANGRYAVVVIPAGEVRSALGLFDALPQEAILLATEPLTPRQRRDLQRHARGGTRSIAVADAITAMVLASEPDATTRAFFDLAVPFGAARPYADTSAQTSLEMFFGREREYRELVDRQGACLVYGGRQLGKTALLKQVELRENVSADRVAIYCDIRPIGESTPADEVWTAVETRLRERKVVLPEGRSFPDRLRTWVNAAPGRYLLILLDEADAFLEREMGEDFKQIGRMKTLMDETRRGVKFVFAGLHNVQRFHRAPNSPLLHFGKSINVGPLLGVDREAARQMALEPMAALGMTFDQPVDAAHMLSLVGFYPSLMQSFGKAVVEAVDARLKQPGDGAAMPFAIDRNLISECFGRQEFRAGVVERFQKTLQLDERYELITYAVWQQAQQDGREGKPTARGGYPASEIRKMADFWWAAGFRDTDSPDSFAAILDEMVEMGVLWREGERYSLRSQRIAAMLGNEAEIDDRLQSFSERAPKRRADPMTSHRRIGGLWSPMSLRQEAVLVERLSRGEDAAGVVLIGATAATGADDVANALTTLADKLEWPRPRGLAARDAAVILDVAKAVKAEARRGKPKLIVVEGWPSAGDLAALRRHRVLRDPHQPVRVIFHGMPTAALLKLEDAPDWLRLMLGPLPLEAMVHWMNREELPFAGRDAVQRKLRDATGGLLHVLDSIKRPPLAERGDADRLVARAVATPLTPEDLGLDGDLTAFARALRDAIGAEAYGDRDLAAWATEQAGADGADRLLMLRALGIVEPVTGPGEDRLHALNPAAVRTLA